MTKNNPRIFFLGIIGNVFDHYNSALYNFLAPFLAPVFFPKTDMVAALILIYSIKLIAIIVRPISALMFGYLTLNYHTGILFSITLSGIAISTFAISLIPTYNQIGIFAPILLIIIRIFQEIFASGENTIARLFILNYLEEKKQVVAGSYYSISTMAGVTLASLSTLLVSYSSRPDFYWRVAFFFGLLAGIAGWYIRYYSFLKNPDKLASSITKADTRFRRYQDILPILTTYWRQIIRIMFISSFTYITYLIPFVFLNQFIPLFTSIKPSALLAHSTVLTVVDILMIVLTIPILSYLLNKYNIAIWMGVISAVFAVTIIPLFYFLPYFTLLNITFVKIWIIILGVGFLSPLNALLFKMVPAREKYLISGFSYAIGTELFAKSAPAICLLLWYFFNTTLAPAIYFAFIAICTSIALFTIKD